MADYNISVPNGIAYEIDAAAAANTFNRQFTSRVLWAQRTQRLEDANVLCVDVALVDWESKLLDRRASWGHTIFCDIAVRKRFEAHEEVTGEITDSEITDLVKLLGDLAAYFMPSPTRDPCRLSQVPKATWRPQKDLTTKFVVEWDDLEQIRQFTGFFPVTYFVGE